MTTPEFVETVLKFALPILLILAVLVLIAYLLHRKSK